MKNLFRTLLFVVSTMFYSGCNSGPSFCECFGNTGSLDAIMNMSADKAEACRGKFSDITPNDIMEKMKECR